MVDTQHETPEPQPEPAPVPVQPEPAPSVDTVDTVARVRRRPSRTELLVGGALVAAGLVVGSGLTLAFTGDDDHGARFRPGMEQRHEGFGPGFEGGFDGRFGGPGGPGGHR